MGELRVKGRQVRTDRPLVMAILNANTDSFSDPGPRDLDKLLDRAARFADEGAAIIDVGAQSGITGRAPVPAEAEIAAVRPVVREIARSLPGMLISVDTFKDDVAEAVLDAGAHIINDVSGLRNQRIAELCARHAAALVIMHTSAPPLHKLQDPDRYQDVTMETMRYLDRQCELAVRLGLPENAIILDPGPDFTKTPAQTIELLRNARRFAEFGKPLLLALSRKDFVGALTQRSPVDRTAGTLGAIAALRHLPEQILRVHDVQSTVDLLAVFDAITGDTPIPRDLTVPHRLLHQQT
ncbi:dihydropteroate synthase [Amycolatopsis sulphurea]|uniref:dihydropteroate synthase n=1 Tax=Amycolatopsis sulphurea TaxID=76022 RepID=A0A2A9FHP5_9PSEU|nr:dihydropteroate synthase [Amycolatopsis sulphurea]PFG50678.1 dihydropteroate synthase [Amycolatopsis sulphurea]